MSNGYRLQLRPIGELADDDFYLEGEPIWDAVNRKVGFFNFEHQKVQWFRIPDEGENENYVPAHQWNNQSIRWKNPDGSWGPWTNLSIGKFLGFSARTNADRSLKLSFSLQGNDGTIYTFNVDSEPLGGSDGWTPVTGIEADGDRRLLKIVDWIPQPNTDLGTKPDTGMYIGANGYTAIKVNAVDVRGPVGVSTGDMTKDIYDSDNDGKVDIAEFADSVPWTGIQNRPAAFPPDFHDASKVNTGIFDPNRIPQLPASRISGIFGTTNIPALGAEKITTGVLDAARIPSLSADKITNGIIDPARLPATVFQAPIVTTTISALSSTQQNNIVGGSTVVTDDGTFWVYKGTGDKTVSTNYQEMADKTPSWNVISDKPVSYPPSAHQHTISEISDITPVMGDLLKQTSKYEAAQYLDVVPGNADKIYVDGPSAAAAIAAGKVVGINPTTGKTEEITGTEISAIDPEAYAIEQGLISDINTVYDPVSKKLVIAYYNNSVGFVSVVIGQRVNGSFVYGKSARIMGAQYPRFVRNPTSGRIALFYRARTTNIETVFVDISTDDPVFSTSAVAQDNAAITSLVAIWDPANNKMCAISNDGSTTRARFILDGTAATPVFSSSITIATGSYFLWSVCYSITNNCFYVVATNSTPAGFYLGFPLAMNGTTAYQTSGSPIPAWTTLSIGTITNNLGMTITYDPVNLCVMIAYTTGSTVVVQQAAVTGIALNITNNSLSVTNYATVYRLSAAYDTANNRIVYVVGSGSGRLHYFFITAAGNSTSSPAWVTPSTFCLDVNDPSISGGGCFIVMSSSGEFLVVHGTSAGLVTNTLRATGSYRSDTGFVLVTNGSNEPAVIYDSANQVNLCFFTDTTGVWCLASKDDPQAYEGQLVSNSYPKVSSSGSNQPATNLKVIYDSISNKVILFYYFSGSIWSTVIQNTNSDVLNFNPTLSNTATQLLSSLSNSLFDVDYDPVLRTGLIYNVESTNNYPRLSSFSFDGSTVTLRSTSTIVSAAITSGYNTVTFDPVNRTFLVTSNYNSSVRQFRYVVRETDWAISQVFSVNYAASITPRDMIYIPNLRKFAFAYVDSTGFRMIVDLLDGDQASRSLSTIQLNNNAVSGSARMCWDYNENTLLIVFSDTTGSLNYNLLKLNEAEEWYVIQTGHIGLAIGSNVVIGKPSYNPVQKSFVIPYTEGSSVTRFYRLRTAQEITNADNVIGMLRASVVNNGIPQIAPKGSVMTSLSGLQKGKKYYLKADGTLTTTKTKRYMGRAVDTTRLYLE